MDNKIFNTIIIKEKLKIDMNGIKLKGDILDVGMENYGVIYKFCKENEDELAIEYFEEEEKQLIQDKCYDTVVLFFTLSKLFSFNSRKRLLDELYVYLSDSAEIVVWDIKKKINTMIDLSIEVILPNNTVKVIRVKDNNIMKKINLKQLRRLVVDYFDIIEEEEKENMIFMRARKKGRSLNESSFNST